MSLVSIRDLSIRFVGPPLLDGVSCEIEPGDRIGLLGRNGAGKSTFLKLLGGQLSPDSGTIVVSSGVKVAHLGQDVPMDVVETVAGVVAGGIHAEGTDAVDDWKIHHEVDQILTRMELQGDSRFELLSSGMKRRALLARALVSKPDLLLLDEPTNHLDIDAITWLEDFLNRFGPTLMFVTHDRMFLRRMANRIFEIDRGRLFDWACDYETFQVRKEQALAAEEKENALFDKRLAEEEAWIRKGIKARRTRNEGRVKALQALRRERSERREKLGTSRLQIQEAQRSGNLVIALDDVSFHYGEQPVIRNFSTTITRQDKIGIIGPNGAGKSTLLKIMLGELQPTSGTVKIGTNVQIAYFDQLREQLDEEATVQDNVADGYDTIQLNGVRKHVLGYLQDFLFTPERARTQVKFLSGGERNRILLAKLFAKPANLIVLDEPTNDLDAETLEMLEDRLVDFQGTVIVVSHDRAFLNNVVTASIVFEGGELNEYVGGYDDWQRQVRQRETGSADVKAEKETKRTARGAAGSGQSEGGPRKLKFKEKRELEQLPEQIERIEAEIACLHKLLSDPEFFRQPKSEIAQTTAQLKARETELERAYQRWEELDQLEA